MKKSIFARFITVLLVMVLASSLSTPFALANFGNNDIILDPIEIPVEVDGSAYIQSYSASISAQANGVINVSFSINGTKKMDHIGATRVQIFENGSLVRTINQSTNPGIMGYNKVSHSANFTHQGVIGRNYYAVVTYQAGLNGGWDNRTLASQTVTAKR